LLRITFDGESFSENEDFEKIKEHFISACKFETFSHFGDWEGEGDDFFCFGRENMKFLRWAVESKGKKVSFSSGVSIKLIHH